MTKYYERKRGGNEKLGPFCMTAYVCGVDGTMESDYGYNEGGWDRRQKDDDRLSPFDHSGVDEDPCYDSTDEFRVGGHVVQRDRAGSGGSLWLLGGGVVCGFALLLAAVCWVLTNCLRILNDWKAANKYCFGWCTSCRRSPEPGANQESQGNEPEAQSVSENNQEQKPLHYDISVILRDYTGYKVGMIPDWFSKISAFKDQKILVTDFETQVRLAVAKRRGKDLETVTTLYVEEMKSKDKAEHWIGYHISEWMNFDMGYDYQQCRYYYVFKATDYEELSKARRILHTRMSPAVFDSCFKPRIKPEHLGVLYARREHIWKMDQAERNNKRRYGVKFYDRLFKVDYMSNMREELLKTDGRYGKEYNPLRDVFDVPRQGVETTLARSKMLFKTATKHYIK